MDYIDTLVFQGGGVRACAYGGVLHALEQYSYLKNIKRVLGTSAGAITALLVACQYNAVEITDYVNRMNMGKLADNSIFIGKDIHRLFREFGYYKGISLRDTLRDLVHAKTGNSDITLQELYTLTGIEYTAVVVNLNTQRVEFCNRILKPHMPAYLAALASSSIPFVFPPVNYEGSTYVDGGITCNFAINYYTGKSVLGFKLQSVTTHRHMNVHTIVGYTKAILNAIMHDDLYEYTNAYVVNIDIADVALLDFNLKPEQKKLLFNNGFNATEKFILKQQADDKVKAQKLAQSPHIHNGDDEQ